ncbi:hypothetical protein ACQY0O_000297 [Thecaphora frezii]
MPSLRSALAAGLLPLGAMAAFHSNNTACTRTYTVQQGDTCDSIGQKTLTSTYQILAFNLLEAGSSCYTLEIGKELCLGRFGNDCQFVHRCSNSDTCSSVAQQYGISQSLLQDNNPILDCDVVYDGLVLCVAPGSIRPPADMSINSTMIRLQREAALEEQRQTRLREAQEAKEAQEDQSETSQQQQQQGTIAGKKQSFRKAATAQDQSLLSGKSGKHRHKNHAGKGHIGKDAGNTSGQTHHSQHSAQSHSRQQEQGAGSKAADAAKAHAENTPQTGGDGKADGSSAEHGSNGYATASHSGSSGHGVQPGSEQQSGQGGSDGSAQGDSSDCDGHHDGKQQQQSHQYQHQHQAEEKTQSSSSPGSKPAASSSVQSDTASSDKDNNLCEEPLPGNQTRPSGQARSHQILQSHRHRHAYAPSASQACAHS